MSHFTVLVIGENPEEQLAWNMEDVFCTREEMEARARASSISSFAVVKDGVWYEQGDMGWWGIIANEKDVKDWNEEFNKLLDEASDDTLLSLYDCHI